MSEKFLEDIVASVLFAIRKRQVPNGRAVAWLRIRPEGPSNLSIEEIADITGLSCREVNRLDQKYQREVAEMGDLLRDFVARADRILEFRRLLEMFDDDFEIFEDSGSDVLMESRLCLINVFLMLRGSPLIDAHTREDLRASMQALMGDHDLSSEAYVEALRSLRSRLGLALEMATPQPLTVDG